MSPAVEIYQAGSFGVLPRFATDSQSSGPTVSVTAHSKHVAAPGTAHSKHVAAPVTAHSKHVAAPAAGQSKHVAAPVTQPTPLLLPPGPPYPPQFAGLGGVPTPSPDVPISAVFLVLFLIAGIAHIKIFRGNLAKSHRFVFSAATAAFCLIRVASTGLRIAWSHHETNIRLAIAAQIFIAAGVVILYITNLTFTQRLLFARHPGAAFKILILRPAILATVLTVIAVIVVVVQSFYTLDSNTHRIDRDIELSALTYLAAMAFLPIPTLLLMMLVPRHESHSVQVSSGRFGTNVALVLVSSALLTFGAGWRCVTNWLAPVPITESPWYLQKACFYAVNFTVEIIVVLGYLIFRADRRYYVPANGKETASGSDIPAHAIAAHSLHGSGYSSPDSCEKGSFQEEKQPLFVQLVLEVDPSTGKYHIGHESVLQQQPAHSISKEGKALQ